MLGVRLQEKKYIQANVIKFEVHTILNIEIQFMPKKIHWLTSKCIMMLSCAFWVTELFFLIQCHTSVDEKID